jgi:hypothetical protein
MMKQKTRWISASSQRHAGSRASALSFATDDFDRRFYRAVERCFFFPSEQGNTTETQAALAGVVTLRKDEIQKVSRYIDRQEEHHSRGRISQLLETYQSNEDDWP